MENNSKKISVVLPNIRSLYNVGSIFRTAECVGIDTIYLCGWTGTPPAPGLAKVALGAENLVKWEHHKQAWRLLDTLKSQGEYIIGLEHNNESVDYRSVDITYPCTLVLGNEVAGMPEALLKRCDAVMHLPMLGVKESLNVSVAFGIAAYHLQFGSKEYNSSNIDVL